MDDEWCSRRMKHVHIRRIAHPAPPYSRPLDLVVVAITALALALALARRHDLLRGSQRARCSVGSDWDLASPCRQQTRWTAIRAARPRHSSRGASLAVIGRPTGVDRGIDRSASDRPLEGPLLPSSCPPIAYLLLPISSSVLHHGSLAFTPGRLIGSCVFANAGPAGDALGPGAN